MPLIMVGVGFPMEAALTLVVVPVPVSFNISEKDDCRNTKISTVKFVLFACLSVSLLAPSGAHNLLDKRLYRVSLM